LLEQLNSILKFADKKTRPVFAPRAALSKRPYSGPPQSRQPLQLTNLLQLSKVTSNSSVAISLLHQMF